MNEILLRFVLGGAVVSAFAILGDLVKPKSFAGLFGAAPSVALATLVLTAMNQGKWYASLEARSMILGAASFFAYASFVSRLLIRWKLAALPATGAAVVLWLGCALSLWFIVLR